MSDIARLRDRLRAAVLAPLAAAALGAGCDSSHTTVATAPGSNQPVDTTAPGMRMPPCPSGDWCTHADVASTIAAKNAGQELGCSGRLEWDDDKPPVDKALPPRGGAELVRTQTSDRRAAGDANACCYHWTYYCPGGRPLLDDGRALLPDVRAGEARDAAGLDADLDARTRAALAAAWLEDARAEHASIASLARAAIELCAVGAPSELIAATQRAGLDEVRHAERCFALASRYAGRSLSPGALPAAAPREASLARVARDTFEEGCVGETLAALAAERALAGCGDEAVLGVLAGIAEDEAEHAALAWRTVAWAVRAGGNAARAAVREAAEDLGRRLAAEDEDRGDADGAAARHGRLDCAELRRVQREGWRGIVEPMLQEILAA